MSAVLEGFAEAVSIGLEDGLEAGAAGSLRLGGGAVVGDEREAVGHVENEAGTVHRWRWGVMCGVNGVEIYSHDCQSEKKHDLGHF